MRLRCHDVWNRTAVVLGTGLGVGYVPIAPGTFGSLWGILVEWLFVQASCSVGFAIILKAALLLAGIPICGRAARHFGRSDPGCVVYDEIAAVPLVFLLTPYPRTTANLGFLTVILGFLWFRIFDISKPWPVRKLERLPGGLGIMADDVAAALYAAVALWLTTRAVATFVR